MIAGTVNADYEAIVRLEVQGPTGQKREVDAIVDTGYNGFLTLPPHLITALGLIRQGRGRATLANGSEDIFDIYDVRVLWDSRSKEIETDAADTTPLVGMALLNGYDLHIQVAIGGRITIEAADDPPN